MLYFELFQQLCNVVPNINKNVDIKSSAHNKLCFLCLLRYEEKVNTVMVNN